MSASREELHRVIEKLKEKDIESLLHLVNAPPAKSRGLPG